MAVAVVIQSATLQSDGYIHAHGTVAGGTAVDTQPINLDNLLGMTVAQIQVYIALQLCIAAINAGQQGALVLTALATTVNF